MATVAGDDINDEQARAKRRRALEDRKRMLDEIVDIKYRIANSLDRLSKRYAKIAREVKGTSTEQIALNRASVDAAVKRDAILQPLQGREFEWWNRDMEVYKTMDLLDSAWVSWRDQWLQWALLPVGEGR
jgi:hypothetical protein